MSASGMFGTNISGIVKPGTFDLNVQLVSMIPFYTLSITYHIKHDTKDLEEYPLLSKGHYIGASKHNTTNKLDNIELQMLTTDPDGDITEDRQQITKICDTTLVSCVSWKQPNMFEREVIAMCVFVWADYERLNCKDARSWKKSKEVWDGFMERKIVLTVDMINV